ncbi:MAG: PIN domain-containing protein [Veillonellaceae bacterium]|nr:PIN domain-containing protein [Veillonellaceae bacterium]
MTQNRIHDECDAVLSILNRSRTDGNIILGSKILKLEIRKISNSVRQENVKMLYQMTSEYVPFSTAIKERAERIRKASSIHNMDSLHIASAEAGKADVFLSTDDKLVRACQKLHLQVRVMNPVSYLGEVIEHDECECECE